MCYVAPDSQVGIIGVRIWDDCGVAVGSVRLRNSWRRWDGQRDGHDRERGAVEEQPDRERSDAPISDNAQEDAEWLLGPAGDASRRREYPEGAEGEVEWCNDVDAASSSYAKANRAQSTANEHDQYAWGFNEYAKRQGFASFLERCGEGERPPRSSGTGRLKPTYDDKGAMRVAEFLPALRSSVAEAVAARSSRCATPPSPSAGVPGTEPLEQRAAHDAFDIPTPPRRQRA